MNSTSLSGWISPAVTRPGPSFSSLSIRTSWLNERTGMRFRFSRISITSSRTPGRVLNSWSTPSIRTDVMAAPLIEERRTRLRALPRVAPYPRSSGSM